MYERFTDRSRKVMQLANQEAQRFNHEYIGTEHMLLGLIKEGSGIAANVLKNLDIDLRKIRLEVEKIVQSGPDMVTMGKLPQTPRAKKVIELAIESARELNKNYVGTEHILIGLVREDEGVAAVVLKKLGVTKEVLRDVYFLAGVSTEQIGQQLLDELNLAKEKAISEQDFEKASMYRDEADAVKAAMKMQQSDEQKQQGTSNPNAEKLRRITCALLLNYTGELTDIDALADIRAIVG